MSQRAIDDVLSNLGAGTAAAPVRLGRYDVVGRLGRGGMGTVYEAIDRERGMAVALKTLSAADAAAHVGLKREFRVVADLSHPNLATVYELASERGVWFFTMEKIEGRSLSEWARSEVEEARPSLLPLSRTLRSPGEEGRTRRSPALESARVLVTRNERVTPWVEPSTRKIQVGEALPLAARPEASSDLAVPSATPPTRSMDEIRSAFAQIVSGVAALHAAGLRHGDIKPSNVLVRASGGRDDGRVVLVDFGLVRPVSERRELRTPSGGTPTFMAPEQFGDGAVGAEADWYSVGATLYRVLTGLLPFDASSLLDLYIRKTVGAPPSPRDLLHEIPSDLSDACMALMSADPKVRPSESALLTLFAGASPAAVAAAPSTESARRRGRVFIGRDAELSALERAYGSARGGAPTLVHAHGPSGIGKSSLLTSFLAAVQDVDSALVLRGRCYERESVPYKGFDRIVDEVAERLLRLAPTDAEGLLPEWSGELGRAFPALASVPAIAERAAGKHVAHDAIELRRRAWVALGELLGALRRLGPIVLTIDDLQWADEDSARLLEALLRGPGRAALLVVILFRPTEARENPALRGYFALSEAFAADGRLVDLPIGSLGEAEAEELAVRALSAAGAPDSEGRARFIAREARGVPFFIEELAHFLRHREVGGADVSVESALLARIGALPEDQRALVEVAAVAASQLPQSVLFEAAGLDQSALPALLALRSASLMSWLGAGAEDTVSVYHDRIRESVVSVLGERARLTRHLAIGRALAKRAVAPAAEGRPWVFDAVRHLGAAAELVDDPAERLEMARLHAEAGERARRAAAFPLASACFEAGIGLLPEGAWNLDYGTTLRLHAGATEAAYLTASWDVLARRIADLKEHARTIMDELVAWEAQIDACVGRHEYLAAIAAASEVLALLGVRLSTDPTAEELGAAIRGTLARLTEFGSQGLLTKEDLRDPVVIAANRIQVRVSPAAYFGKPVLLPMIACNLVTTSIERGVSPATPYALALFGIVLNTLDLYPVSHEWGELALRLLERWPDRRLEAATRHILRNLVCCWMVPLSTVLDPLREVWDIGCQTGDYEYASYAAHGYVHNAIYAGRALGPLLEEALALGAQMRSLGQVNALHVHTPFEQVLKALTGRLADPACLDGDGFVEEEALAAAEAEGSRSGIYVLSIAMGLVRWFFGDPIAASRCFERARAYVDAAPSVWHQPIMHQFAALSACAAWPSASADERVALRDHAERSLGALRKLASFNTENFAHRVSLVEAVLARLDGDRDGARGLFDQAIRQAQAGSWINDVALANELAAGAESDPETARRRTRSARTAYVAWGATAKAERVSAALSPPSG